VRDVVNCAGYDVPFTGTFTQAVRVEAGAGLLFVSGITARDQDGTIQGLGDVGEQTDWILRQLGQIAGAAGATLDDVVKVTVFVRDSRYMPIVRQVKHEHFGEPGPASTTVEVSGLFDPAQLIEIEAVLTLPAAR
jgi:enamine deaminase RidA (YjgF/YER057c/UK114 family)